MRSGRGSEGSLQGAPNSASGATRRVGRAQNRPGKSGKKKTTSAGVSEPVRYGLTRRDLLFPPLAPALLLLLTLAPRFSERPWLAGQLLLSAGAILVWYLLIVSQANEGRPLLIEVAIRKPHYVQMVTQTGVYLYWAYYYAPVSHSLLLIVAQIVFAYATDALLSWSRAQPWVAGFAPVPIVLSTNLFLWFQDDYFWLQLLLIAFAILSKSLFRWERHGARRHIFNPSSIALALFSFALLVTSTTDLTFAREIAESQDAPPHMHEALFLLGLIVQLYFPVVLVTMSAAITICLLGAVYTAATGIYLFTNTSIPAAVLLGALLLITDPATSPRSRLGKVLFGSAYGAMVVAAFPILESFGPYGYFDKLLPVPVLNLLVPRIERWAERLAAPLQRGWVAMGRRLPPWVSTPHAANRVHVAGWVIAFLVMRTSNAVGKEHEGQSLAFWERHCVQQNKDACARLHAFCNADRPEACHNFGLLLADRGIPWTRQPASYYLERACRRNIAGSCGRLGDWLRRGEGGAADLASAAILYQRGCDAGDGLSCHNLGVIRERGLLPPTDQGVAQALYQRACELGVSEGCAGAAKLVSARAAAAESLPP